MISKEDLASGPGTRLVSWLDTTQTPLPCGICFVLGVWTPAPRPDCRELERLSRCSLVPRHQTGPSPPLQPPLIVSIPTSPLGIRLWGTELDSRLQGGLTWGHADSGAGKSPTCLLSEALILLSCLSLSRSCCHSSPASCWIHFSPRLLLPALFTLSMHPAFCPCPLLLSQEGDVLSVPSLCFQNPELGEWSQSSVSFQFQPQGGTAITLSFPGFCPSVLRGNVSRPGADISTPDPWEGLVDLSTCLPCCSWGLCRCRAAPFTPPSSLALGT